MGTERLGVDEYGIQDECYGQGKGLRWQADKMAEENVGMIYRAWDTLAE